ncbi:DNA polymerase III subunit delta' C-terminal domain-containing protein [Chungangia koreensis]|uniref:DNA polymerase III subunit delta' n=1 Tax=Chungangia koreensis TaxID=752657 RepID=A0ABV8X4G2_9LACT
MEQWPIEKLHQLQPLAMKRLQSSFAKKRVAHAYAIEGEKGTGKEAISSFLIQLILCEAPLENVPCETCRPCRLLKSSNHPNVLEIFPDGQDIKKDQVLQLIYSMNKTGLEPGKRVYVLHEADRMNIAASNTLLKFLEEPEGEVTAILLTDRYQAILPTIQSRCQHIGLRSLPLKEMIRQLKENGMTEAMASSVSKMTRNMDEAVELANSESFAQARKTVLKLVEVIEKDVHEALLFIQEEWLPVFKEKEDTEKGLDLLLFAYEDIISVKTGKESSITYPDHMVLWKQLALHLTYEVLADRLDAILNAKQHLQRNMNRTLLIEQLVLNLQEGSTFV